MTNILVVMTELKEIGGSVRFGNNQSLEVKKIGKKKGKIVLKNKKEVSVRLNEVKYVPGLYCNLISITQLLNKDFVLAGTKNCIEIKKGKT